MNAIRTGELRTARLLLRKICEADAKALFAAGLNRVYCMVRETNIASIRVCEKAGMTLDGKMRKHFKQPDGSFVDVRVYSILASEISSFPSRKMPDGYRLIACDGSSLHYATDPSDSDRFFQTDDI